MLATIVCDVVAKVDLVLECVRDKEHTVKTIVLMEAASSELVSRGQRAGIQILSLQEMEVRAGSLPPGVSPNHFLFKGAVGKI